MTERITENYDPQIATRQDFKDITTIWRMAFADSDEYIGNFLKMMYKDGNAIVSREEGVVVSMAFLLEAQLVVKGRPYSAYYFYAAATHPNYRCRGHMERIMNYAKKIAKERGIDFLVLVPAEDYLYDYYAKFGFETSFYKKVVHVTREELKELSTKPDLKDAFSLDIFETRQTAYGLYDFLNWGAASLKYAMFEHKSSAGKIAFTSDGYAMYHLGKEVSYVKEICTTGEVSELFTMLLLEDDTEKYTFNLPVDAPFEGLEGKIVKVGMCVSITEDGKLAKRQMNNAYIGLTLG